jgi:hypothetical protein
LRILGLAPATQGQIGLVLTPEFWNQKFVKYALISDTSHAIYTVIVSYVGHGDDGKEFNFFQNMEFFVLTR